MRVTWEVEDGYCGGSRPHTIEIDDYDLENCETEEERQAFIKECVNEDFIQRVSFIITNIEE